MVRCWDSDPKQRLDFSHLIRAISNSLDTMTDYLKVSLYSNCIVIPLYTLQFTLEESMTTVRIPFVDKVDQRFIVPRCCLDMTDIPLGTGIQCAWIYYAVIVNVHCNNYYCSAGAFGETFKATVRKNEDVIEIAAVKVINGNSLLYL